MQTDIKQLEYKQIEQFIINLGEKKFRAKQIYEWMWKKNATSFDQMTNISEQLREKLSKNFCFNPLKITFKVQSKTVQNLHS